MLESIKEKYKLIKAIIGFLKELDSAEVYYDNMLQLSIKELEKYKK